MLQEPSKMQDLLRTGLSGDRQAFREELENLARTAEERGDQQLVSLVQSVLSDSGGGQIEDKTNTEDRIAAFHRKLDDPSRIPIGLSWVKTDVKMEEVILPADVRSVIEDFISEQDNNEVYLANGLEPRNKCMLMGPPGNGKTALSNAIANRMGCPLYFVRYDALISQKPGETSKRMKKIFDFVKTHRCILFFDEVDAIGKERDDDNEAGEMKRVVSTLLVQLDDVPPHVVVLGASNHPKMLDRAIWRRFHIRVSLPKPDIDEFADYLSMAFKKYGHEPEVSLRVLARRLDPENFAELEVFVDDCIRAWLRHGKQKAIEEAVEEAARAWPRSRAKIAA